MYEKMSLNWVSWVLIKRYLAYLLVEIGLHRPYRQVTILGVLVIFLLFNMTGTKKAALATFF